MRKLTVTTDEVAKRKKELIATKILRENEVLASKKKTIIDLLAHMEYGKAAIEAFDFDGDHVALFPPELRQEVADQIMKKHDTSWDSGYKKFRIAAKLYRSLDMKEQAGRANREADWMQDRASATEAAEVWLK